MHALKDTLGTFFARDPSGASTGQTLDNALRVVRLNMLLNVETEGAYVPPGAGYLTVTLKEGSGNTAVKPFKAELDRLKVPEEHADAIKKALKEIDELRAAGDTQSWRITELEAEVRRITETVDAAVGTATAQRVADLRAQIDARRAANPADPTIAEPRTGRCPTPRRRESRTPSGAARANSRPCPRRTRGASCSSGRSSSCSPPEVSPAMPSTCGPSSRPCDSAP